VQERLGAGLRAALAAAGRRPAIVCTGAALAFLTGGQVHIPVWVDRACLGWLWRLCAEPRRLWRRTLLALGLAPLVWRHRERLPPLRA
jgi:UDP-N-acetyl-D-mannosaminuronic acid transferase (WecB/TagA/CpsF family)